MESDACQESCPLHPLVNVRLGSAQTRSIWVFRLRAAKKALARARASHRTTRFSPCAYDEELLQGEGRVPTQRPKGVRGSRVMIVSRACH